MNRFIVPVLTVLLAAILYAGSVAYDHYVTARSNQKHTFAMSNTITPDRSDKNITVNTVPDFTFTTLGGKKFNIADLRGSVVILNFWATWCAPCITEFPDLLDIVDEHKGNVILLAISSDLSTGPVQKFITELTQKRDAKIDPTSVHVAMDPGRKITRDLFHITTYPESFIIARDGTIMRHIIGIDDWHKAETQELIKNLVHNAKLP